MAHDLVAAVDSEEREFLADPDKIRLPAGSNGEVVVRQAARDWLDRKRAACQTQPAQPVDNHSLRAMEQTAERKSLDSQGALPVDLEP